MSEAKKIRPEWTPNAYQENIPAGKAKEITLISPMAQNLGIYPTKKSPKNKKSRR